MPETTTTTVLACVQQGTCDWQGNPIGPVVSATPQIVLTDPAVLSEALAAAGTSLMGRAPTEQDVQAFVAEFHAEEIQQQTLRDEGETYYVPSVQGHAEAFIETHYPTDVAAARMGSELQQLQNMMGGTAGIPGHGAEPAG